MANSFTDKRPSWPHLANEHKREARKAMSKKNTKVTIRIKCKAVRLSPATSLLFGHQTESIAGPSMNWNSLAIILQFVHHIELASGGRTHLDLALQFSTTNRIQEHINTIRGRKTHIRTVSFIKHSCCRLRLCYLEKPVLSVNQDARSLLLLHKRIL